MNKMGCRRVYVVERLPSMHQALSLRRTSTKQKKKKQTEMSKEQEDKIF